jgi:hypothetical protein
MLTLSIDVSKIDKSLIKEVVKKDGTTAKYINLICWPNRNGVDDYGNSGTVKQSLTKEQREAGHPSPIIGNFKDGEIQRGTAQGFAASIQPSKSFQSSQTPHDQSKANGYAPIDNDDDIPF